MSPPATPAWEPGQFVRLPARPDWGLGQVQSVAGTRVTVNFEHAGKVLVNTATAALEPSELPPATAKPATRPR